MYLFLFFVQCCETLIPLLGRTLASVFACVLMDLTRFERAATSPRSQYNFLHDIALSCCGCGIKITYYSSAKLCGVLLHIYLHTSSPYPMLAHRLKGLKFSVSSAVRSPGFFSDGECKTSRKSFILLKIHKRAHPRYFSYCILAVAVVKEILPTKRTKIKRGSNSAWSL